MSSDLGLLTGSHKDCGEGSSGVVLIASDDVVADPLQEGCVAKVYVGIKCSLRTFGVGSGAGASKRRRSALRWGWGLVHGSVLYFFFGSVQRKGRR